MRAALFLSIALIVVICGGSVYAAGEESSLTLEQRMIRLEEQMIKLGERMTRLEVIMEERFKAVNQRIDDLNASMEASFTYVYMLLAAVIAFLGAVVGSVVWMARQDRPVSQRHYEQILRREDEIEAEIRSIKRREEEIFSRLEKRVGRIEEQLPVAA